jgi:hypothetical protein
MKTFHRFGAVIAAACFCASAAAAQEPAPAAQPAPAPAAQPAPEPAPPAAAPAAAPAPCCTIAAELVLDVEIVDQVSSGTHRRGQTFPIRLAEDVTVDGRVVLPAGTTGVGEVIHSAKGSFGGKPGELILAARYLEHRGTRIAIRGLRYGGRGRGRDNSDLAFAASVAAGPLGFLISGGEKRVPAGTLANVRVTADVTIAPDQ